MDFRFSERQIFALFQIIALCGSMLLGSAFAGPAEPEYDDDNSSKDRTITPSDFLTTGPVGAVGKILTRPNTTQTQEHEDRERGHDMSKNWRKYTPPNR